MATFSSDSNRGAMNSSDPTRLIDIIRKEGRRLGETHCGLKYLMAYIGEFKDFQEGRIKISRKDCNGVPSTYRELRAQNYTDQEIRGMFVRFFTRDYVSTSGHHDPPPELVQKEWLSFKNSPHTRRIKSPNRCGGKVTYAELIAEGKSEAEIEKIFNTHRHKSAAMQKGSYRHKMYEELQKMLSRFDARQYYSATRVHSLSPHVEKHSKGPKPATPTTFCDAVARMMTLVRLSHQESRVNERRVKTNQLKAQKKIANDKRATKYNALKTQMGTAAFNKMKARDQATKEQNAAARVSQPGMIGRTAEFVKWRTQTAEGKAFDDFPKKAAMSPYAPSFPRRPPPANSKHLGYTTRPTLASVLRKCLDNPKMYSNVRVKFNPDPTDASSQLYQYAPIFGRRPPMLRKTRDADTNQTFSVCGLLKYGEEYYIQPDQPNGLPMRGNVYYSLPTKWKEYEKWSGFGIMGNPQKSTNMETLFKVVDNNIAEVSFVVEGKGYKVGYTAGRAMSFDKIFAGIRRVPTAAAAAALLAEEEKRHRAKASKEKERRRRHAAMNRMLGGEHQGTFNQFFGVGTKQEDASSQAKANLAMQLASGKISQATFNIAMDALS